MNLAGNLAMAGLRAAYSDHPVPPRTLLATRRWLPGTNPLEQPVPDPPKSGADVRDPALARIVDGHEIGVWALGPATLDFLAGHLRRLRPASILEFGSGVSTVCLAWLLSEMHGAAGPFRLVSLEQEPEHAAVTERWLAEAGLASVAAVVVAPLGRTNIDGRDEIAYQLSDEARSLLARSPAELIIVDGPRAEPGGRFATLPLARSFAGSRVPFVLDDALRDGELGCMARWQSLSYVEVEGVRLIEKGLLLGWLAGSARA